MMQDYVQMIEKLGDKVAIDTKDCILWGSEHPNCFGCPSELGCAKLVSIKLVAIMPLMYQPASFEDFQKMSHRIEELTQRILNAKTPKELKEIPTT